MAALACLLLAGAILAGGAVDSGQGDGIMPGPADAEHSSYNTGPYGLKGIYTLMEARGTSVSRWRRAPASLGPEVDRLVVWQPWIHVSHQDWDDLGRWVEQGGTLILSFSVDRGIRSVVPAGEGAYWVPWISSSALPEIKPAGISPLMQGVGALRGSSGMGVHNPPEGAAVYAVNADGHPVIIRWQLGAGEVWYVTEPELLANGWILEADNATLAVNLLEPGPGGHLAFHEYHHGAQAAEDWWQTLRPQMRFAMLQAVLAALALLVLAGARLGRPVEAREGISRDAVEFAHGLANLLRESRANRWVLERLYRNFVRELARHLGASPKAGHAELSRLWQRHTGEAGEPLAALLDRAAAPLEARDRELLQLLRQMGEYRRRIKVA